MCTMSNMTTDMSVSNVITSETYNVTLSIDNGPVLPVPHSRRRSTFRAMTVNVSWYRAGDGVWHMGSGSVGGPVLKKDGTEGEIDGLHRFYSRSEVPYGFGMLIDAHGPDAR
jgi:hypothetical protein